MKARIRELIHIIPFQPFVIHMAKGREYRVEHPDFVLASPNNQSWIIIEEPDNDRVHYIAALLIVSIEHASDANLAA